MSPGVRTRAELVDGFRSSVQTGPRARDVETVWQAPPPPIEATLPRADRIVRGAGAAGDWYNRIEPSIADLTSRSSVIQLGTTGIAYRRMATYAERFEYRGDAEYEDQLLSAMRKQFGGREEKRSA